MEHPLRVATATPENRQTCRQQTNAGLAFTNTAYGLLPACVDLISGLIHDVRQVPCQCYVCQPWKLSLYFLACLLLVGMAPISLGAPIASIQYHQHGRVTTCLIATCRRGYETVPCTTDGSTDTCQVCPADKYQPVDNITSDQHLSCFQVYCAPDNQRLVRRGEPGPGNPPVCECDTSRNYYQHSNLKEDCRHRLCDRLENLMLNGSCVCKEGRVRNKSGRCVWRELMSPAAAPTTSAQGTQSQVTQILTSNTAANDVMGAVSTLSPTVAISTTPTTATTGISNPGVMQEYKWLIIVLVVLLVLGLGLGLGVLYKVVEWRRRRYVREIPVTEECHRLTSKETSTGTPTTSSETSEKEEKSPSHLTINNYYNTHNFVGNRSVQYGDHNQTVQQGAAEQEEKQ
ncbi:uncharacterized protein [Haliotis asinina]|uniref:uncharacterized protein n=1 Tax=Haliotis asinina TaxID=109174 RepID=UPI003531C7C4